VAHRGTTISHAVFGKFTEPRFERRKRSAIRAMIAKNEFFRVQNQLLSDTM